MSEPPPILVERMQSDRIARKLKRHRQHQMTALGILGLAVFVLFAFIVFHFFGREALMMLPGVIIYRRMLTRIFGNSIFGGNRNENILG